MAGNIAFFKQTIYSILSEPRFTWF